MESIEKKEAKFIIAFKCMKVRSIWAIYITCGLLLPMLTYTDNAEQCRE